MIFACLESQCRPHHVARYEASAGESAEHCGTEGVLILAPGELITEDIIKYIKYAKEKGCQMTGTEDINLERLNVLA